MTTADAVMLVRNDNSSFEPISEAALPSVENEADRLFERLQLKK